LLVISEEFCTINVPPLLKIPPPPWSGSLPLAVLLSIVVLSTSIVLPAWFQRPPPSAAASLSETEPPNIETSAIPLTCIPPPFPGFGVPVEPFTPLESNDVFAIESVPSIISIPPPARLAELLLILPPITFTSPAVVNTPPPEPEVPVAVLLSTVVFTIPKSPPLLKIPPPPLSASFPDAVFIFTIASVTVIVAPAWFQSPPPSLAALLAETVPPVMEIVAALLTCIPPPLPGLGVPAVPFTSFMLSAVLFKVTKPSITSIPPPARLALFCEITAPVTVTVPPVLKIPPPEPEVPSAKLLVILVPANTSSVPPLLKIPPPPSSAAAPLAILFVIGVPSTVMVPVPFQRPPPSRAAILLSTVPPVSVALAAPLICSPPPLPGAAVAGSTPALLVSNVTLVSVTEPSISSIPPPALLAWLSVIITSVSVTSPAVLKTPPPEPAAPSAILFVISVPAKTSSVPPLLKTPPPPLVASSPEAVLLVIGVPSIVMVPVPFQRPPPSAAATLLSTVPPVMVALAAPLICKAPPLPGAAVAGETPALLLFNVELETVSEPSINSIPPPALFARLLVIITSVRVKSPAVLNKPPPEPEAPSATLFTMFVPFATFKVPPLLKIPPPPLVASSPEAVFPSMKVSVNKPPIAGVKMFIVPSLFHNPPPSLAAIFANAIPLNDTVAPFPVT